MGGHTQGNGNKLEERIAQLEEGTAVLRKQRDTARVQRDEARAQRDVRESDRRRLREEQKARNEAETRHRANPKRHDRIGDLIEGFFREQGLASGAVLEIGGRDNPYRERFSQYAYTNLDLGETGPNVLIGDITDCPHIDDASFDAIISVDVFEHINRPWLAAKEIGRLLKPGGLCYHSTLFSWRYHPCPIDYWRFTPEALRFLFADLEHIDSGFDDLERRRNIMGRDSTKLTPDAFGGWRENWRLHHAGKKPG